MSDSLYFMGCVHPPTDVQHGSEAHLDPKVFSADEVDVMELSGVPLTWQHQDPMCVGRVHVSANSDGSKLIFGEVETDSPQGLLTAEDMWSGKLCELSLSHKTQQFARTREDGYEEIVQRRIPIRVGITDDAKRKGCAIFRESLTWGAPTQQQDKPILSETVYHSSNVYSSSSSVMADDAMAEAPPATEQTPGPDPNRDVMAQMADEDNFAKQGLSAEAAAKLASTVAQKNQLLEKQLQELQAQKEKELEQLKQQLSQGEAEKEQIRQEAERKYQENMGRLVEMGRDMNAPGFEADKNPEEILASALGGQTDTTSLMKQNRLLELVTACNTAACQKVSVLETELEQMRKNASESNARFQSWQSSLEGRSSLDQQTKRSSETVTQRFPPKSSSDDGAPPLKRKRESEEAESAQGTVDAEWMRQLRGNLDGTSA